MSATSGSSSAPASIVAFIFLYAAFGSLSFITASLKTLEPKIFFTSVFIIITSFHVYPFHRQLPFLPEGQKM